MRNVEVRNCYTMKKKENKKKSKWRKEEEKRERIPILGFNWYIYSFIKGQGLLRS